MKTFDKIAEEFDKTRIYSWPETVSFIKSMKKNSLVLDLGCGSGRDIKSLLQYNHKVIGLDSSKKMLEIAKRKYLKVKFIHANMIKIPLKDNSIDYVICIASFHHLKSNKSRLSCLKEIRRVLKKNGKLFLSVWYKKGKKGAYLIPWQNKVKRYYYFFTEKELKDLFKESNFKIIELTKNKNYYIKSKPIQKAY